MKLTIAVLIGDPELASEVTSSLRNFEILPVDDLEQLRFANADSVDLAIVDADAVFGRESGFVNWLAHQDLCFPIILICNNLTVAGLQTLFLEGHLEPIRKSDAHGSLLSRTVRHTIEKHMLCQQLADAQASIKSLSDSMVGVCEHASAAMLVLCNAGNIAYTNSKGADFLNRTPIELIGQPFGIVMTEQEKPVRLEFPIGGGKVNIGNVRSWKSHWFGENCTIVQIQSD